MQLSNNHTSGFTDNIKNPHTLVGQPPISVHSSRHSSLEGWHSGTALGNRPLCYTGHIGVQVRLQYKERREAALKEPHTDEKYTQAAPSGSQPRYPTRNGHQPCKRLTVMKCGMAQVHKAAKQKRSSRAGGPGVMHISAQHTMPVLSMMIHKLCLTTSPDGLARQPASMSRVASEASQRPCRHTQPRLTAFQPPRHP